MWSQFILQNSHFAINFFAALVMFAVFWLYFDAWIEKKPWRGIPKVLAFLILALSYVISAAFVENTVLGESLINQDLHILLISVGKILGYVLLVLALVMDPFPEKLNTKGITQETWSAPLVIAGISIPFLNFAPIIYPIFAALIGFLYLRRVIVGLESHLKVVGISFLVISIAELLATGLLFRDTQNVVIHKLVAPYGLIWIIQHLFLLAGVIILGNWVWRYLFTRLQSQLFMIFTASTLVIFLITTASFTALLLKNIQTETLSRLETDVKVLKFALDSQKQESLSDAQFLASSEQLINAVNAKDTQSLASITEKFLISKKLNTLIITDANGRVIARGEDSSRVGDSWSENNLFRRTVIDESLSGVVVTQGALVPEISVHAAVPLKDGDLIIGTIIMGTTIDNAFVDGVKQATNLEAAVYADNILSATTLVAADGKSRWVGTKEENSRVTETVLQQSNNYTGSINLFNVPYFAAYTPLTDIDEIPVGMLFVGNPQINVFQTANRSLEATFFVAAILIVLLIYPSYRISKYISDQLQ